MKDMYETIVGKFYTACSACKTCVKQYQAKKAINLAMHWQQGQVSTFLPRKPFMIRYTLAEPGSNFPTCQAHP
jgi:hypothetical protein